MESILEESLVLTFAKCLCNPPPPNSVCNVVYLTHLIVPRRNMPTVQLVALLALLAVIAFGSNELSIPAPTFRYQNNPNSQGWSPKPTASARFRYPPVLDLLRRQDDVQKTCGYVNAEQSSSLTCATGYCAYDAVSYAFGCCTDVEYNTAVNSLVPGPACSYADITTCHGLGNSFTQAVTGAITWYV